MKTVYFIKEANWESDADVIFEAFQDFTPVIYSTREKAVEAALNAAAIAKQQWEEDDDAEELELEVAVVDNDVVLLSQGERLMTYEIVETTLQ